MVCETSGFTALSIFEAEHSRQPPALPYPQLFDSRRHNARPAECAIAFEEIQEAARVEFELARFSKLVMARDFWCYSLIRGRLLPFVVSTDVFSDPRNST